MCPYWRLREWGNVTMCPYWRLREWGERHHVPVLATQRMAMVN